MSRFNAESADGEQFVYGFDRPLQQYFLDRESPEDFEGIVGPLSSPPVYGSARNLLEKIDELKITIPEQHRWELRWDLPLSPLSEVSE